MNDNNIIRFTIYENPVTKKNHGQIIRTKNGPILIPSKPYIKYEAKCKKYMPDIKSITKPVNIKAVYYRSTKHNVDLTNLNSALHDVLVKYKVLQDDNRDIAAMTNGSKVLYDKHNPRTEVEITFLEGYEQWSGGNKKC